MGKIYLNSQKSIVHLQKFDDNNFSKSEHYLNAFLFWHSSKCLMCI
jgi:hypothetical protein